jgi:hypothetical protein
MSYSGDSSCTMNEDVPLLEGILNEQVGLLEVRSHFVAGDVKRVDDFMIDPVFFGVADIQHRCRGQNWIMETLPCLIFFCLSKFKLEAAM